jgi:hypothetical protein
MTAPHRAPPAGRALRRALAAAVRLVRPAAAQSLPEIDRMLALELHSANGNFEYRYDRYLASIIKGTWFVTSWSGFAELGPQIERQQLSLGEICKRQSMTVDGDLNFVQRFGDRPVHGRFEYLRGVLFNMSRDRAEFAAAMNIDAASTDQDFAVSILRGAADTLVLTPRGPNLLVGYSILNAGQPTVFVRCPPG